MFKFAENKEVLWPVTIKSPSDNGTGSTEESEIKVRFKLMSRESAMQLESVSASEAEEILLNHVLGWEGIVDVNDQEIPFNRDNLKMLLNYAYIERAFSIGLLLASTGAAVKN